MKHRLLALMMALCLILLSSCIPFDPVWRYDGEHSALAAAAIYSIPGASSSSEDTVLILENDQYGRTLYACYLSSSLLTWEYGASKSILAILVTQKSDAQKTYFYGEQNYLFAFVPTDEGKALSAELVTRYFSESDLLSLKENNRWNQGMIENDPLLSSASIQLEKGENLNDTAKEAIRKKAGNNIRYEFLRRDSQDHSLYFILSLVHHEDTNSDEPIWYIAMIDSTGSLMDGGNAIQKLDKSENVAHQILEFKDKYGWSNC